ncbi:MAG: HAD family hydrolase [Phycisphaerales bacterium]|nr:HAD family hydrolase [Phycisphaerales bacterium]
MSQSREDRSITGPLPISHWLRIAGVYFLATLGAVGTLTGLLLWYDPANPVSLRTRLIISAVALVIAITAVAVTVHVALHYRFRYRHHRFVGLVRDLYASRSHLMDHYASVLRDATSRFRVVGISLHTLMTDEQFIQAVPAALANNPRLEIDLIFRRPFSAIVDQREQEEEKYRGRISHDCLAHIRRAVSLRKSLGNVGSRFRVFVDERFAPSAFLLQRDDEIYLEPYLHRRVGRSAPTFVLRRNEANQEVFDAYAEHLDLIMEKAQELTEVPPFVRAQITEYGRREERKSLRRAVFLDRDGIVIEDVSYLSKPEQLRLLTPMIECLKVVAKSHRLVVVTNQSGIARGFFTEADLQRIHEHLLALLEDNGLYLDAIYYCPHHPEVGDGEYRVSCECRKPRPGLLRQAAADLQLDLADCIMVGDSPRDCEAGRSVQAKTLLVAYGASRANSNGEADQTVGTIEEAVRVLNRWTTRASAS